MAKTEARSKLCVNRELPPNRIDYLNHWFIKCDLEPAASPKKELDLPTPPTPPPNCQVRSRGWNPENTVSAVPPSGADPHPSVEAS